MNKPSHSVPERSRTRASALGIAVLCVLLASLTVGCLFENPDNRTARGGGWDEFPNARQNTCGPITPDQMRKADSLVGLATAFLDGEAVYLASDTGAKWSTLKRRDVDSMQYYYGQALQAAPNHCGALFGNAITATYSVVEEDLLDSLVREAEGADLEGVEALAKMSGDQAGAALLDVQYGLARANRSLLTLAQDVGEKVLLPKLDVAIAGLQRVVDSSAFRFHLEINGDSVRLDRGEAAPLLAALKVSKALVLLVVGYEWRIEADESYPFLSILKDMGEEDLDAPTLEQKQALDHYTALAVRGSGFSRFRAGWGPKVAAIPELLLQATGHIQQGLQYGITQYETKDRQTLDPVSVGIGEEDEIDPADLRDGIARLELLKKYLTGEVLLTYGKGANSLRVDFPKFFKVDGFQQFLPYFRFHPYAAWNDSLPAENGLSDRVKGPIVFTNAAGDSLLNGTDVDYYADDLSSLTGKIVFPDPTMGGIFPDLTNANFWPTIESLESVSTRTGVGCGGGEYWDEVTETYVEQKPCRLPVSPSDLDILVYYLSGYAFALPL